MLPMLTSTPYALYAAAHPFDVLHGMPPSWLYHGFHAHDHWPRFDAHDQWRRARVMEKTMNKALRLQQRAVEAARQKLAHAQQQPSWRALNDHEAEITLRLPALADDTLAARLSEDGRSLTVTGTTDSCACQKGVEIQLPYAHALSGEDIELSLQDDGLLTVKALRKKPSLDVKIVKASPPPEKLKVRDAQAEEKVLESKFKIAVASIAEQASVVDEMKKTTDVDVGAREPEVADEKKSADEAEVAAQAAQPPSGSDAAEVVAAVPEEAVAVQAGEA